MTRRYVHINGINQVLFWDGPGAYVRRYTDQEEIFPGLGKVGLYIVEKLEDEEELQELPPGTEVQHAQRPEDIRH